MKRKTLTLKEDTQVKYNPKSIWSVDEQQKIQKYSALFLEMH